IGSNVENLGFQVRRVKVTPYVVGEGALYKVTICAKHAGHDVSAIHGIHPIPSDEVNSIMCGKVGPKRCLSRLMQHYQSNPSMIELLPTLTQLKNRKQYLARQQNAELLEWGYSRLCASKSAFMGIGVLSENSQLFQNAPIVLDCFKTNSTDSKGRVTSSFGLIITSRHAFRNVERAVMGQTDGVLAAADGTYKLHF
ncbi:TPA: hypothetical protein N0F65_009495, partial [Lagenidium giganteum]